MKMKISDWMEQAEPLDIHMETKELITPEAVEAATLRKIHAGKPSTAPRISRLWLIAAILAGALCVTACATAVLHWRGFALTKDLTSAEQEALLAQAASTSTSSVDADGTVRYYDSEGNEILALSPEEAAAYEQKQQEAWEQSILESTSLVNLSTMEFLPSGVTELATDLGGHFDDFLMGNGHMALLHPAGADGYALHAGDTVTIALDSSDVCYLRFGLFQDGQFLAAETVHAKAHSHTYEILEDGLYCFSVEYYSADASRFTGGTIVIE